MKAMPAVRARVQLWTLPYLYLDTSPSAAKEAFTNFVAQFRKTDPLALELLQESFVAVRSRASGGRAVAYHTSLAKRVVLRSRTGQMQPIAAAAIVSDGARAGDVHWHITPEPRHEHLAFRNARCAEHDGSSGGAGAAGMASGSLICSADAASSAAATSNAAAACSAAALSASARAFDNAAADTLTILEAMSTKVSGGGFCAGTVLGLAQAGEPIAGLRVDGKQEPHAASGGASAAFALLAGLDPRQIPGALELLAAAGVDASCIAPVRSADVDVGWWGAPAAGAAAAAADHGPGAGAGAGATSAPQPAGAALGSVSSAASDVAAASSAAPASFAGSATGDARYADVRVLQPSSAVLHPGLPLLESPASKAAYAAWRASALPLHNVGMDVAHYARQRALADGTAELPRFVPRSLIGVSLCGCPPDPRTFVAQALPCLCKAEARGLGGPIDVEALVRTCRENADAAVAAGGSAADLRPQSLAPHLTPATALIAADSLGAVLNALPPAMRERECGSLSLPSPWSCCCTCLSATMMMQRRLWISSLTRRMMEILRGILVLPWRACFQFYKSSASPASAVSLPHCWPLKQQPLL